jgi:hypothetical protein
MASGKKIKVRKPSVTDTCMCVSKTHRGKKRMKEGEL